MSDPLPHVIMDVGPAVHQQAGLARYTLQLAQHLLRLTPERPSLTFFYNDHSGHTLPPFLSSAPRRTARMGQVRWRLGALASQLLRVPNYARAIAGGPQNGRSIIYHATEHLLPRLPCPTVLTVHDLIFERYPEHHTRANRAFLKLAMPRFVRAADLIIAVSEQTRQDLIELYDTPSGKIRVIHEGIESRFQPAGSREVTSVQRRYSPERPYLLMVGTLEPRKNHATALAALARLKAAGLPHRLVIVGGEGWMFEPVSALVDELDLADDVCFAGYVPDEDLPPLYSGAACVVQPSLYEGFGFPILEAMACGAPVVCSDASSLPEIAGDAALLVAPTDVDAWVAALQRLLYEEGLRSWLRDAGQKRAAQFSWKRCASQTLDVYREAAALG